MSKPGSSPSPNARRSTTIDAANANRSHSISIPEIASSGGEPIVADDDLWSALQSLSLKQREVVAYHHLAGLPYAEIATILGTNEAAARRAAADGIKKLRAIYGEAPDEHLTS